MSKPEQPKTDTSVRTEPPRTEAPPPPRTERGPFEWPFPTPDAFSQLMRDQIARTQSIMEELAVYESVATQRARTAVNDLAKLATDSIGYMAQLSAEWRRLAVDAGRKATEMFTAKA